MRFTIERLRTAVLAAGVLLVAALAIFLARGKLKNPVNLKELPQRLGVNIQADASGYTFDHSLGGQSRYRIHASKVAQYKDNHAVLHDVMIELFGEDGNRVDRIQGAEFEYDQAKGTVTASGPVEITLTRPKTAAGDAGKTPSGKAGAASAAKSGKKPGEKPTPIAAVTESAERGDVHVKTSGLTFDTKSGLATTSERVDFTTMQGSGSSIGASYDAKGLLVLDKGVELNTRRGGQPVQIHAEHAEFERAALFCRLHAASATYKGGDATAGDAGILFRDDGSAVKLDAQHGFNLRTATGGQVAAPAGSMEFDQHNQPQHGHMEGGVKMDSTRMEKDGAGERRMRGSAPTADLDFTAKGELRHVHLERGVDLRSESVTETGNGAARGPLRVSRTWLSPVADVTFRDNGHGQAEPETLHGVQGVVVTGESQAGNGPAQPSRLAADDVTGTFGPDSALTALNGIGHASVEETTATGVRQTSTGDRLDAHFVQGSRKGASVTAGQNGAGQIDSAVIDGHVALTQTPTSKGTAQSGAPAPLRAWAGRAVYEGTGEWLHLTISPRVEEGGLQLTADKVDVSHASGNALAHGDVKATWLGSQRDKNSVTASEGSSGGSSGGSRVGEGGASKASGPATGIVALGGQGPAHVVAEEAELSRVPGEAESQAIFRGRARLWQQSNSVSAPMIVLDRQKQTLVAHSSDAAEPVRAVLLSAGGLEPGAPRKDSGTPRQDPAQAGSAKGKPSTPAVIRVRGGDLKYSDAERKAVMRGGDLVTVVAETPTATSVSSEVELLLLPPGNHAGNEGGESQVDRMTARGHVVVTSEGRRGTGEQLVYSGATGDYVLTGTSEAPPRMTDPVRGNVTGAALIFHSRDDSVSVEGGGGRTTTETRTPK